MPSGFDIDPGGFSTDLSGTIAGIAFTPGQYGVQAIVTIDRDEPFTMADGTLVTEKTGYYDVDAGFNPDGNGGLINADPSAKITARSKWGKFVNAVADVAPQAVEMITAAGGGAYAEAGWGGHRFHFEMVGAGEKFDEFTNSAGEVVPAGKKKGLLLPVEYLGTSANPVTGEVGATAPVGFSITTLPDDVIEVWGPLAESSPDNAAFMKVVMSGGLFTPDKLGDAYGPTTKALGDGSLKDALTNF